jgi:hypothetical protein
MNGTIKLVVWTVAGLLVFGAITLVGLNARSNSNNGSTNNAQTDITNRYPSAITEKDVAATITYTGKGFEPDTVTIESNNTVRVRNRSIRLLQFVSDPYIAHTDEPELNISELKPGESATLFVSQKGAWGYHNALDPSEIGRLIAQ